MIEISFKTLYFINLTEMLLVLTMFIQRANNLMNIMGKRIVLTFANWDDIVQ